MFRTKVLRFVLLICSITFGGQLTWSQTVLTLSDEIDDTEVSNASESLEIDLTEHFDFPNVIGDIVLLDTDLGAIALEMYDQYAPGTVTNFLKYVTDGDYDNSMFHRSSPGFVIQAGGFYATLPISEVPQDASILNEPFVSNRRGMVSMAKLGSGPNTATSEWFINLANNSANLDTQNGGFTVFARVIGTGMTVADAIALLPRYNFGGAFDETPVEKTLTGDVTVEDWVAMPTVRIVDLFPVDADSPSFVAFTASSDNEELVQASLEGSQLKLALSPFRIGSATVTVVAEDKNGNTVTADFELTLAQLDDPVTTLGSSAGWAPSSGSTLEVSVNSNTEWSVVESLDWVSVAETGGAGPGTVTLTVDQNAGTAERMGTLTIGGQTYTITQNAPFDAWLAGFFSAEEIAAMVPSPQEADTDFDGLSNGLEQALGLSPNEFSKSVAIVVADEMPYLEFNAYREGLAFNLQVGSDLINWTTIENVEGMAENGVVRIPLPVDQGEFFRLEVVSPSLED